MITDSGGSSTSTSSVMATRNAFVLRSALIGVDRVSGAVACAALADSLDERYGARSRRRIEIPNAMLQVMVDNLKAEAFQLRMRIVTRAASRGAPVEPAQPQDHSHIEEELSEGDIQGSFAHGI